MVTIQLRRGASAEWVAANPVLANGEVGIELGVGIVPDKGKIGDGVTHWDDLPYSIDSAWVPLTEKGVAGGVATLDVDGYVPLAQLPDQAALDADIANAIAALVDAAPGTLDTLNELAAALGDDANFAASVTTALAGKAATGHAHSGTTVALAIALSDETTAITTGDAKVTFRMPFALTLTAIRASLSTASSSGIPTVDINEGGTTILSTKLTIDATEKTSVTAAVPVVISDSALADDAEITFDIDVAGTGAKGLKVYLIGTRP